MPLKLNLPPMMPPPPPPSSPEGDDAATVDSVGAEGGDDVDSSSSSSTPRGIYDGPADAGVWDVATTTTKTTGSVPSFASFASPAKNASEEEGAVVSPPEDKSVATARDVTVPPVDVADPSPPQPLGLNDLMLISPLEEEAEAMAAEEESEAGKQATEAGAPLAQMERGNEEEEVGIDPQPEDATKTVAEKEEEEEEEEDGAQGEDEEETVQGGGDDAGDVTPEGATHAPGPGGAVEDKPSNAAVAPAASANDAETSREAGPSGDGGSLAKEEDDTGCEAAAGEWQLDPVVLKCTNSPEVGESPMSEFRFETVDDCCARFFRGNDCKVEDVCLVGAEEVDAETAPGAEEVASAESAHDEAPKEGGDSAEGTGGGGDAIGVEGNSAEEIDDASSTTDAVGCAAGVEWQLDPAILKCTNSPDVGESEVSRVRFGTAQECCGRFFKNGNCLVEDVCPDDRTEDVVAMTAPAVALVATTAETEEEDGEALEEGFDGGEAEADTAKEGSAADEEGATGGAATAQGTIGDVPQEDGAAEDDAGGTADREPENDSSEEDHGSDTSVDKEEGQDGVSDGVEIEDGVGEKEGDGEGDTKEDNAAVDDGDQDPSTTEGQGVELNDENTKENWEGFSEDFESPQIEKQSLPGIEGEKDKGQTNAEAHDAPESKSNGVGGYEGDGFRFHIFRPKGAKGEGPALSYSGTSAAVLTVALVLCACWVRFFRRRRLAGGRRVPNRGTYAAVGSDDFFNGTFSDDVSFGAKDSDEEYSDDDDSYEDGMVKLEMGGIHEMDANGGLTLDECNG